MPASSAYEKRMEAESDRDLRRRALLLGQISQAMEEPDSQDIMIVELRIQGPAYTGQDYRMIIKGRVDGDRYVSFQNGNSVEELLQGLRSRVAAGNMKWREDLPWTGPESVRKSPE